MPATIRYIVNDIDDAIAFYVEALGFRLDMHPAPGFAALSNDDLRLLLNRPGAGGAGTDLGKAGTPSPGGWNRFQVQTSDLDGLFARLTARGCTFRSGIIQGNGGRQVLVEDPSGNPVELFEPGAPPR